MTIWFVDSAPVKGVCIQQYVINEFGEIIDAHDDETRARAFVPRTRPEVAAHRFVSTPQRAASMKPVRPSARTSSRGSPDPPSSHDNAMASQLQVLVKDAQVAFQEILNRNAHLEHEMNELKSQSSRSRRPSSETSRFRTRSVTEPARLATRRQSENFPVFSISTPPRHKDYIDLSQGRRGLSVFNG